MNQTNQTQEHCLNCLREGKHTAFAKMLEDDPSLVTATAPDSDESYLLHFAANLGDVVAGRTIIHALEKLNIPLDDIKDLAFIP